MRRILSFKSLWLVAVALSIAGMAWFAAGDLLPLNDQARRTTVALDASCDYALEQRATEAWLADAFDLARVPGDGAVPPLERMLADDRDVFVPAYPTGSYQDQIDAIRAGTMIVRPQEPGQPLENIDWSAADLGRYYATQLHGWTGLVQLLGSRERLSADVEDAIASVIRDWFRCNGVPPGVSTRAWFEGTIVKRLSAILLAIDYYRAHGGLGDLRFIDLLYLAATNKDELLVANYSYRNHGLRQDIMLMSFIGNLPYIADRREVRQLAERRLNKIAKKLFSDEGIWKEHAPGYVYYALRLLTDLDRVAADTGLSGELPILEKATSTAAYLRQILTPEGDLPPIGMSGASGRRRSVKPQVAEYWGIEEANQSYLADRSVVFEDYGQAIYSSSRGGQLYLLFQAVQNLPAAKRNADELSFIVHNYGRWWLVDSGHYTNERTPVREFLVSARAHNTYIRGEQGLGANEQEELDVALTGFSDENGVWQVSGRSDRFLDGAAFERTIAIDKSAGTISVRDSFNEPSGAAQTWRGFLHLAPDLEVTLEGSSLIATDPASGRAMRIALEGAANLRVVAGQDDPLQGWVVQDDQLLEAPVLEFETSGAEEVAMAIAWR
ncbi:MAG: heparinase II/III domain-containing protein [Geminicoccaceae bacterium]